MNLQRLQGKKVQVNLTLDQQVVKRIEQFKIKHEVNYISPLINEILIEWLDKNE